MAASMLLAGCISSDVEVVDQASGGDSDRPADFERTVVGESVTTEQGNTIEVREVVLGTEIDESDLSLVLADVEICAGDDGDGASAGPANFRASIADAGLRRPIGRIVRQPPLRPTRLASGECTEGWVVFPVQPEEEVTSILLLASTTVEWALP